MKRIFIVLAVLMTFVSANAFALTYTIEDNWVNWPGYTGPAVDEIGTPEIDFMTVTVDDSNLLQQVTVQFRSNSRRVFDSLFINVDYDPSNWDAWDYYVFDRDTATDDLGTISGELPVSSGLYSVLPGYDYTLSGQGRYANPNGIDKDSLSELDLSFLPDYDEDTFTLAYDFSMKMIDVTGGFFIAYAPFCANDVIGAPVPEPGTLLLLGGGLVGLAYLRKRKKA